MSQTIQTVLLRKRAKIPAECIEVVSASSSHAFSPETVPSTWWPVAPPGRGECSTAFHAYMLLPGFSVAYHAETLSRSRSMVSLSRKRASEAAQRNPALPLLVRDMVGALTPADGVQMARLRGRAHLPYWSRLAICEWRKSGVPRKRIAETFNCSLSTVGNVLAGGAGGYEAMSGLRRLTQAQLNPPGKFLSSSAN